MQFHNPEVLYALFFLIIPVLVHLFQLRRFRREYFTNVKFLKKLSRQTRKSSRFKKWLVLTTRLFILGAIIIAFAQPYFPEENPEDQNIETVIYLDNSYSMQATGQQGRLLDRSVQDLLENLPEDREFTLITNDEEYSPVTRNDLQEIEYSSSRPDFSTLLLRAQNQFSANPDSNKKFLLISDFQENIGMPQDFEADGINIFALSKQPERKENIQLDSAFISRESVDTGVLNVILSYTGDSPTGTPVSLYNGEQLMGKSSVGFSENKQEQLQFPLEDQEILNGLIQIEDNSLEFDNNLYFTVNETEPIKVSSISAVEDDFLNRIYTAPEFEYNSMPLNAIDYNRLISSQVIILNEIPELSNSLLNTLQEKAEEDVVIIVIPSEDEPGQNFRLLMRNLGVTGYENRQNREKLITGISFQHPLFRNVFEEQIQNFEYPKVQMSYELNPGNSPILSFQDQSAFLFETGGNYFFTAPLNRNNSNFIQSPLVVPSFNNMGASALQPAQIYYNLGTTNRIEVPVPIQNDQILQISSNSTNFIPQQQIFSNKVEIITEDLPRKAGNYGIFNKEQQVMGVSFNLDRTESSLDFLELENSEDLVVLENIQGFFTSSGFQQDESSLWKWFVALALFFLLIETLLLKYLK